MRTDTHPTVKLEDYKPSPWLITQVSLNFYLHATETEVSALHLVLPNPKAAERGPLVLDGDELTLVSLTINERPLSDYEYEVTPESLTILSPPDEAFRLAIKTRLNPSTNTKLMGLYRSGGIYCTQCEADGFRRITYFLDRPDVLATYHTTIFADKSEAPVLLSNGNLLGCRDEGDNRHSALWHDPHPKPSYLFALVAGNLGHVAKDFTTKSGRKVKLAVYVEPGKEDRAGYALNALERSMVWDEQVFGREYDLDVFNIVAVSDFNMGAMENKGLNIFNDKYVLASADTATDADYAAIEAIIAHEYFHNWSGNRVTCRDWFQLCLKEGLTVFRDQEFSSDERSRAVHRIAEVKTLRSRQFAEDASPLAHPVRPTQYSEINNFYTATVYEKGAEIVRMLKTIIGTDAFRRGMDLYFERYDGTAATVEDFLSSFSEVTGRDLSHFAKWYAQSGTPRVTARGRYDEASRTYTLDLSQVTAPTPGQPAKEPMEIPVLLGLVSRDGSALDCRCASVRKDGLFILSKARDTITFTDVPSPPVPSLFREFSAPVKVEFDIPDSDLLTLLQYDDDPFNRWQAGQTVALRMITGAATGNVVQEAQVEAFIAALESFLIDHAQKDPAFAALVLTLPAENDIAQEIGANVNPDSIHEERDALRRAVANRCLPHMRDIYRALSSDAAYSPDATNAGRRSLRNVALDMIARADTERGEALAVEQLRRASNMTDRLAALSTLAALPGPAREEALDRFGRSYETEPLVLDKWFALQASIPEQATLARIKALMNHPGFSLGNPNRVRSLVASFAMMNPTQFHRADGAGYDFLTEVVSSVDPMNPQLASRLLTAFSSWRMMEPDRAVAAERALEKLAERSGLSRDVADILNRTVQR